MKKFNLNEMVKGWFVGDFDPSVLKTNDVEVAIKKYNEGDHESAHFHKIATEITVVLSGKVKMFDKVFADGDIIVIQPGEMTAFMALTDVTTVVVKYPGAKNDKYMRGGPEC
jgi:mannose-6-phosphate isomerase-like protein (cupin superfamily)